MERIRNFQFGKVIKNFSKRRLSDEIVYVISDILNKGIAFICLPLYTSKMTVSDFGLFSVYQVYASIFTIFMGISLSRAVVLYYISNKDNNKKLTTVIWITIISSLIFTLIIYFLQFLNMIDINSVILLVLLISTLFGSFYSVGLEVIRANKKAIRYCTINIVNVILTNLISLILIFTSTADSVFLRLISILLVNVTFGLLFLISIIKENGFGYDVNTGIYFLKYSLPLIPFSLASLMLSYFDRLFLEHYRNALEVGLYSFAYNIGMFLFAIVVALNRAIQPHFFDNYNDQLKIKHYMKKNFYIFSFMYFAFILLVKPAVIILGNIDYMNSIFILPLIALGLAFYYLYSIYENVLLYNKNSKAVAIISLISLVITILSNYLLIPTYGYFGAAISTIVSYFSLFAIIFFYVKAKYDYKVFSNKFLLFVIFIYTICPIIEIVFFNFKF